MLLGNDSKELIAMIVSSGSPPRDHGFYKSLGHGYVASWEPGILLVVRTGEHFRVQFRRKSWIDRGLWLNRYHERVPTDVCFHVYLFLTSKYEDDQPVQVLVSMSTFRISPPRHAHEAKQWQQALSILAEVEQEQLSLGTRQIQLWVMNGD